jgi:hypothetical protein
MNELVRFVRAKLNPDARPYPTVPFGLAYIGAKFFDLLALITGRDLAISSLRVKKFCTTTQFAADRIAELPFVPPVSLPEGLGRTLSFEFGSDAAGTAEDQVVFESE